jgi:hypothetical protein
MQVDSLNRDELICTDDDDDDVIGCCGGCPFVEFVLKALLIRSEPAKSIKLMRDVTSCKS